MTITAKPRGRALAKAALLSPIVLGLTFGPAAASMATTEDEAPQSAEEALVVEVPALADLEVPGIGESTHETLHTWSLETEVITDTSTEEGPIGIPGDSEDSDEDGAPEPDEGGDGSEPNPEPTDTPTDEPTEEPTSTPTDEPAESALCEIGDAATADKVVLIDGTGGANADATTCEKDDSGKYVEVSSYDAQVGYNGIAAEGAKVEGDGKTPAGTFALTDGFGINEKPSAFTGDWTKVKKGDIWVDDPNSPLYNTYVPAEEAEGVKGEQLYESPAYDYAQIIDYNPEAIPGAGSAIFLHVNTGSGKTAGCVSLPESDLLDVFEWADADTEIQIVQ